MKGLYYISGIGSNDEAQANTLLQSITATDDRVYHKLMAAHDLLFHTTTGTNGQVLISCKPGADARACVEVRKAYANWHFRQQQLKQLQQQGIIKTTMDAVRSGWDAIKQKFAGIFGISVAPVIIVAAIAVAGASLSYLIPTLVQMNAQSNTDEKLIDQVLAGKLTPEQAAKIQALNNPRSAGLFDGIGKAVTALVIGGLIWYNRDSIKKLF